jgi:hypothetical protein
VEVASHDPDTTRAVATASRSPTRNFTGAATP